MSSLRLKHPVSARLSGLVFGVCLGLLAASLSCAQAEVPEPPVTFRTLALEKSLEGVFYEVHPGQAVPLVASISGFSAPYIRPTSGLVQLYREEPPVPPETKPRRVPVAEALIGKGGPWLLLISSTPTVPRQPPQVNVLVVDDSWEAHPVRTIRVLNFLKKRARAAVKIGGATMEIPAGGSHIFPYPGETEESWVQVAVQEEDGWVLRSSEPKATFPKTRSTLVLSNAPPSPLEPEPRSIMVNSLIDAAPPQPAPVVASRR